jgi:NAD(P)-dependent dehydrogenase (short-subunit alcohol dehydrogenase family)
VRAVLVTGGAKRLGAAFARALAASGWKVGIHYNSSAEEAERLAAELSGFAVGADLSDLSAAEGLVERAEAAADGPLTGLVNSASIFEHDRPEDAGAESLTRHFAVNAGAPALLARAFAARAPEGAAIVNLLDQKIASPQPDHYAYTLSKAALAEATRLMAQAFAPKVRVMGVAPGYCLPSPTESDAAFERKAAEHNLTRRRLEPADVAACVRFALECPALTGSVIFADAGEHLVPKARDVVFS